MPKTKISEFSSTPASNTDIDSINISEGCAPSGINDAIRELMAQLKDFQTGAVGDSFNGPVGTTTAAAGAFTTLSSTGNTTLGDASGDSVTINGTATFANANPTLSAGTANGVAYLNGSKVVTSGSALTFSGSALGVNATSTDASMSIQALTANYASVLSLVANNDNGAQYNNISSSTSGGTVHWRIGGVAGTSQLPFSVGGSEQMRLTSTGLGIGTSSPSYKLDVRGSSGNIASWSDGTTTGTLYAGGGYVGLTFPAATGGFFVNPSGNFNTISTNGVERMRIDSSGNLGLGVTPSAWEASVYQAIQLANGGSISGYKASAAPILELSSNQYYDGGYKYVISAAATKYSQNQGVHSWSVAPSGTAGNAITFTQAMTLNASGNAQIGTTTDAGRLTVSGKIRTLSGDIELDSGQITTNSSSNPLKLGVDGSEKARIDSSGNFIVGSSSFNAGIVGFGAAPNGDVYMTRSESTNSYVTNQVYSTGAAVYRFYVGMAGTVYAASTSISAISDQTLKTNIRDLETGLTEVMALKPRRFDWKNGDAENVAGFVAQEVEQVLPELVSDYKYSDTETKKSLKMGDILPTLVKAIQEQQAIINQLKARLDAANL